jgi:DNA-binding NarL/FixJ family response regulator
MEFVSHYSTGKVWREKTHRRERMAVWSVLIVDDSPAIRKVICELFTREGDFEVCGEAENGQQAIEKALQLQPDLIVTDLSMPAMNGLEATRILRKQMPDVPIILYSAHIDAFVEREALTAGASAAVHKSDVVELLIARSRSLLDESAA